MLTIDLIAEIAHEANAAYCRSIGDITQPHWLGAPDWQQESAMDGVTSILDGSVTSPEQSHENWMALKLIDGWKFGATKDTTLKTHPNLLPYSELSPEQRTKDEIFFRIVRALTNIE